MKTKKYKIKDWRFALVRCSFYTYAIHLLDKDVQSAD